MNKLANFFSAAVLAVVAGFGTYWMMQSGALNAVDADAAPGTTQPIGLPNSKMIKVMRPRPADQGPHPKIAISGREFQFGTMAVNEEKSHTYVIRNTGEATLKLEAGTPTCKCTEFSIKKSTLEPGEKTEVFLEWVPKAESQQFRQHAPIYTNDPNYYPQPLKLVIEGKVLRYLGIMPVGAWNMGTVSEDRTAIAKGEIFSPLYDDFELVDVEKTLDAIRVEKKKMTPEELRQYDYKSGYSVSVELDPGDAPVGKFEETVSFSIDKDPEKRYKIFVRGQRSGPVQVYPKAGVIWSKKDNLINLSQFSSAEGKSGELILFFASTKGFKANEIVVESVEVQPSFVDCKIEPAKNWRAKDRMRFDMKISIPPNSPPGAWSQQKPATVKIKTNHPSLRELKFGLHFIST